MAYNASTGDVKPYSLSHRRAMSRDELSGVELQRYRDLKYASGCVVQCRICNREVAGSNLSLGLLRIPTSTQPSIPPGSESAAAKTQGVQVNL